MLENLNREQVDEFERKIDTLNSEPTLTMESMIKKMINEFGDSDQYLKKLESISEDLKASKKSDNEIINETCLEKWNALTDRSNEISHQYKENLKVCLKSQNKAMNKENEINAKFEKNKANLSQKIQDDLTTKRKSQIAIDKQNSIDQQPVSDDFTNINQEIEQNDPTNEIILNRADSSVSNNEQPLQSLPEISNKDRQTSTTSNNPTKKPAASKLKLLSRQLKK